MTATLQQLVQQLDYDAETLLRVLARASEAYRKMRLMLPGEPGATRYDTSHGAEIWCDVHERSVATCHRNEQPCTGVPLDGPSDPTGTAAVSTRAFEDDREFTRRAARIHAHVEWLVGFIQRWDIEDVTPAKSGEVEADNEPKCERHLRYGYERASRSQKGTRVRLPDGSYVFAEPHRLCEFCEDLARDLRRLPTEHEVHANMRGQRIMRSA